MAAASTRLLDADTTAAVILGASDWTEIGLGRAPSFRGSARGILRYLIDTAGLGLDPELIIDLFDDTAPPGEQMARMSRDLDQMFRERRDSGRPIADVLVYYVGHGITDRQGSLTLLVRRSRKGHETSTGIKAADLAETLKVSAPQQRRLVVLDCCFSEAAARAFIGMGALEQAVAATTAKDLTQELPRRGGLLLCSSLVDDQSIGIPDDKYTLFSGALIDVLREGIEEQPPLLSFADLCELSYTAMRSKFGARTPRPVLHPVNQTQGDLTRLPAFPNRAAQAAIEAKARRDKEENDRRAIEEATRLAKEAAERETIVNAHKDQEEKDRRVAEQAAQLAKEAAEREAIAKAQKDKEDEERRVTEQAARQAREGAERKAAAKAQTGNEEEKRPVEQEAASLVKEDPKRLKMAKYPKMNTTSLKGVVATVFVAGIITLLVLASRPTPPPVANQPTSPSLASLDSQGDSAFGQNDFVVALQFYQQAANLGDAYAQNKVGWIYDNGLGVTQDYSKAFQWFQKAANQGNAAAENNIGLLYLNGFGVSQDYGQALKWYQKAADQGNAQGEFNVGGMYDDGWGTTQDYNEAMQWYQKAADEGNADAQYDIGLHYLNGWGVTENEGKARDWINKGAAGGSAEAQQWLTANPYVGASLYPWRLSPGN